MSEVHTDHCPVFGINVESGLHVPSWARIRDSLYLDVVVASIPRPPACDCATYVSSFDAAGANIIMSPRATKKRRRQKQFYFVHSLIIQQPIACEWRWSGASKKPWWRTTSDSTDRAVTGGSKQRDVGVQYSPPPSDSSGASSACTSPGGSAPNPAAKARGPRRKKAAGAGDLPPPPYPSAPPDPQQPLHVGDHSIEGLGALTAAGAPPSAVLAPNLVGTLSRMLGAGQDFSHPLPGGQTHGIGVDVVANLDYGAVAEEHREGVFNTWGLGNDELTAISARYGVEVGQLSQSNLAGYVIDGNAIDTKKLESALRGRVNMGQDCLSAVVTRCSEALTRNDNVSMYAKGWILALLRHQINVYNGDPANGANQFGPDWAPPGADFVRIGWENALAPGQIATDIERRRFMILARDLDATQINCLAHLSRPGTALAALVAANPAPRLGRIEWFAVPMTLYFSAQPAAAFVIGDYTPEQMVGTITWLARERKEQPDLVRGFYKALTVLGQKLSVQGAARSYFTSTLERATTFHWPTPLDSNPLWRWLGLWAPLDKAEFYSDEFLHLSSLPIDSLSRIAMAGSALLSVGVSLSFHRINVNGEFLNQAALPVGAGVARVTDVAKQLFAGNALDKHVPLVFRAACAEVSHTTGVVLDWTAFGQDAWCANYIGIGPVNDNTQWMGAFSWRIPYLLDPFCTAWSFNGWPRVFGVFSSGVRADTTVDCVKLGPQPGWYADLGDSHYRDFSTGSGTAKCFEFIPYGTYVLNGACQHLRRGGAFAYQYRTYSRSDAQVPVPGAIAGRNLGVGDYSAALHTYTPGCMITFDWMHDQIQAPLVTRATLGVSAWTLLSNRGQNLYNLAGLVLPKAGMLNSAPASVWDMGAFFGATAAVEAEAQEN